MTRQILLLTATIRPRGRQPELRITDPQVRLGHYRSGLAFHSKFLEAGVVDGIVFADNSGYDLADLREEFADSRIEWIGFHGLDYDPAFHRGYGEFRLIDEAHRSSRILQGLSPTDRVWKVTGRYQLRNLAQVIRTAPQDADLYCDARRGWVEMSVLAWTLRGYEQVIQAAWNEFASGAVPEVIFARRIEEGRTGDARVVSRFRWPMRLVGLRGGDGTPYQGRWTPVKFGLQVLAKSALLALRGIR